VLVELSVVEQRYQAVLAVLNGSSVVEVAGRFIERFHRTLRTEFLAGRVFASVAAAQRELDGWVDDYNARRPHQGSGWRLRCSASPGPVTGPPAGCGCAAPPGPAATGSVAESAAT